MASNSRPSLIAEIGPDGIARESAIIAYTEKVIEEEQLQLKRYIKENYSKIRDVERELENLTLELKLTAGPKKAALEHMRKKIELVNERLRAAKLKEEQAKKAWEAAAQVVKDEEAAKQKLCDDLNQLVQESANTQYSRLEELKRRLEALNPSRVSSDVSDGKSVQSSHSSETVSQKTIQQTAELAGQAPHSSAMSGTKNNTALESDGDNQLHQVREKKPTMNPARLKKNIILKSRAGSDSGWTGAGFDVEGRT
ncbi:hypothetical protein KFK09_019076 [Dendrobium nobile]|uniref:RAB6-interacting golgin n=1 Tax=Dendrobium nobile TaxID=94219 RepID=A0A8T3AY09_DENNO|nr:hypothetical protein KFK09_019076 [Dendrobium nobile]